MFLQPSWESFLSPVLETLVLREPGCSGLMKLKTMAWSTSDWDIADDDEVDVDVEDALDGGVMDDSDVECLWNGITLTMLG